MARFASLEYMYLNLEQIRGPVKVISKEGHITRVYEGGNEIIQQEGLNGMEDGVLW